MKKYLLKLMAIIAVLSTVVLTSCTENYSNGERIGLLSKFSHKGWLCKTWEGDLTLTQTGMNQSGAEFPFSIDRDAADENLVKQLDSAAQFGYKVKLTYHQVKGFNWFSNRGETDYFVTKCEILDKNHIGKMFGGGAQPTGTSGNPNAIHDTIYVVIVGGSAKPTVTK